MGDVVSWSQQPALDRYSARRIVETADDAVLPSLIKVLGLAVLSLVPAGQPVLWRRCEVSFEQQGAPGVAGETQREKEREREEAYRPVPAPVDQGGDQGGSHWRFSSLGKVVVGGGECVRKERGRDGSVRRREIG